MKAAPRSIACLFSLLAISIAPLSAKEIPVMGKDIVQTAESLGSFKTLTALFDAAGLTDIVKRGHLTILAPNDEAFAKLPAGTVENLLKPENKELLQKILFHHLIEGKVTMADALKVGKKKTLESSMISITLEDGITKIEKLASVIIADIPTSHITPTFGGMFHVIDTVLMERRSEKVNEIIAKNLTLKDGVIELGSLEGIESLEKIMAELGEEAPFKVTRVDIADMPLRNPEKEVQDPIQPENEKGIQATLTPSDGTAALHGEQAIEFARKLGIEIEVNGAKEGSKRMRELEMDQALMLEYQRALMEEALLELKER